MACAIPGVSRSTPDQDDRNRRRRQRPLRGDRLPAHRAFPRRELRLAGLQGIRHLQGRHSTKRHDPAGACLSAPPGLRGDRGLRRPRRAARPDSWQGDRRRLPVRRLLHGEAVRLPPAPRAAPGQAAKLPLRHSATCPRSVRTTPGTLRAHRTRPVGREQGIGLQAHPLSRGDLARRSQIPAKAITSVSAGANRRPAPADGVAKWVTEPRLCVARTRPLSGASAKSVAESMSIVQTAPPATMGGPALNTSLFHAVANESPLKRRVDVPVGAGHEQQRRQVRRGHRRRSARLEQLTADSSESRRRQTPPRPPCRWRTCGLRQAVWARPSPGRCRTGRRRPHVPPSQGGRGGGFVDGATRGMGPCSRRARAAAVGALGRPGAAVLRALHRRAWWALRFNGDSFATAWKSDVFNAGPPIVAGGAVCTIDMRLGHAFRARAPGQRARSGHAKPGLGHPFRNAIASTAACCRRTEVIAFAGI